MKKKTETSSFGVSSRVGHNAERFYNSNMYRGIELTEVKNCKPNELSNNLKNKIFAHSSEKMMELPDNSVWRA